MAYGTEPEKSKNLAIPVGCRIPGTVSEAEGRGFEPRFPLQFHSKILARLILKRSPDLSFVRGSDQVTKRSRCDVNVRVGGTRIGTSIGHHEGPHNSVSVEIEGVGILENTFVNG